MLLEIVLLVLIIAVLAGGNFGFGGVYANHGNILGVILFAVLVIWLLRAAHVAV